MGLLRWTPTILGIVVLLAFVQKKNVVVDIELIADQISFSVEESPQGMKPQSIESVPVASIALTNFKEIELFSPNQLLYDGKTVPVKGKVLVRPWEDASSPRITLIGKGMRLVQLDIGIGSRVTFRKSEGGEGVNIKVEDKPSEGTISLGNNFTLLMEQCDLVNEKGSDLISRDENMAQRTLEISLGFGASSFVSDDHSPFEVLLDKPEEEATLFSTAAIRGINFNDYNTVGNEISTVKSGTVKFKSIPKKSIPLEPGDFIDIPATDVLKVVRLSYSPKDNGLTVVLSGSIDSLKLGKGVRIEQLPSLLEWLASNELVRIMIAVLGWVIAQTLALRKEIIAKMKT